MSQNKTKFPGVGQEAGNYSPNYHDRSAFSRGQNAAGGNERRGTAFSGMNDGDSQKRKGNERFQNQKPIIGFLYSVSHTIVGEYWPLHYGQNVIGSSPECDVVLPEATVSGKHAILHINKMKKPDKTEATIADCQSTNGTMLNGNSVSVVRPLECVNGDIITIGECYDLFFILIDLVANGLKPSDKFMEIYSDEDYGVGDDMFSGGDSHATRDQQDFPPHFERPEYQGGAYRSDSTVGMDSGSGFSKGGTKGMNE